MAIGSALLGILPIFLSDGLKENLNLIKTNRRASGNGDPNASSKNGSISMPSENLKSIGLTGGGKTDYDLSGDSEFTFNRRIGLTGGGKTDYEAAFALTEMKKIQIQKINWKNFCKQNPLLCKEFENEMEPNSNNPEPSIDEGASLTIGAQVLYIGPQVLPWYERPWDESKGERAPSAISTNTSTLVPRGVYTLVDLQPYTVTPDGQFSFGEGPDTAAIITDSDRTLVVDRTYVKAAK